jgi:hypothetical protein
VRFERQPVSLMFAESENHIDRFIRLEGSSDYFATDPTDCSVHGSSKDKPTAEDSLWVLHSVNTDSNGFEQYFVTLKSTICGDRLKLSVPECYDNEWKWMVSEEAGLKDRMTVKPLPANDSGLDAVQLLFDTGGDCFGYRALTLLADGFMYLEIPDESQPGQRWVFIESESDGGSEDETGSDGNFVVDPAYPECKSRSAPNFDATRCPADFQVSIRSLGRNLYLDGKSDIDNDLELTPLPVDYKFCSEGGFDRLP